MLKLLIVERVIFLNAIQKFLKALNDRIQEVSSNINEINDRKNVVLELENLFVQHKINKNNITGSDLTKLNNEEFSRILEIVNLPRIAEKKKAYEQYCQETSLKATNWLKAMGAVITGAFKYSIANEAENLASLKESIATYKCYQAMFRGDDLIKPIFDMREFHNLLIICRMNIADTATIKFIIGKASVRLVLNKNVTADEQASIQKYQIILDKKQKTYADYIPAVEQLALSLEITIKLSGVEDQITALAEAGSNLSFKNIQNAVVCILLKAELDSFAENQVASTEQVASLINNAEFLLKISRRHKPKNISNSKTANESDKLIIQAKNILEQEQEFLKNIKITLFIKRRFVLGIGIFGNFLSFNGKVSRKKVFTDYAFDKFTRPCESQRLFQALRQGCKILGYTFICCIQVRINRSRQCPAFFYPVKSGGNNHRKRKVWINRRVGRTKFHSDFLADSGGNSYQL